MENDNKEESLNSIFEQEGIIIESQNNQGEESMNEAQIKDVEIELFNAVGAEIKNTTKTDVEPLTGDIKRELNDGGIEILPHEPTQNNTGGNIEAD